MKLFAPGWDNRLAQLIGEALPGTVGPDPPAPGAKLAPVPSGMEKQLMQVLLTSTGGAVNWPLLGFTPGAGAGVPGSGAPVDTVPGFDAPIATNGFWRPQGRKFVVNLEWVLPETDFSSVHS